MKRKQRNWNPMTDETFTFRRMPDIYFGVGKFTMAPNLIREFGQKILVVTGLSSFSRSKYWDNFWDLLKMQQIKWIHVNIGEAPSPEMIDNVVNQYRDYDIQAVMAIGGGSVIDAGKALAAMLHLPDSIKSYLPENGTQEHDGFSLPLLAIPTTAGTGSEITRSIIITERGDDGFKEALEHSHFIPTIALVDPDLTTTCPPHITAYSGMNAFTRLLESYLSYGDNDFTNTLSFKGLSYISKYLMSAYRNGNDLRARTGVSYAAMVSGISTSNSGLGSVYGIATSICERFDIPFGVACGSIMGAVNKMTLQKLEDYNFDQVTLEKYNRVGRLFHKSRGKSDNYYRNIFIEKIFEWTELLEIPRLSSYGITLDDIPDIVEHASNENNPLPLDDDEIRMILERRL